MIKIKDLRVVYDGETVALERIDLSLKDGVIIGIIGPNGAGKSTLMKAMLDLIVHDGQTALFQNGQSKLVGQVAYVEQKSHIDYNFPITVRECVSLGIYKQLGLFKTPRKADWAKVDQVLSQVGLLDFKYRPIKSLSGGQFQRMLVARCLVQEADYIFLDEPFVGIDSVSESIIINLLKELKQAGKTILIVHHDLSKVKQYFDQLVILNKKIIAYGDVKDVFCPGYLKQAYSDMIFVEEED